jgi:hypothetical protein
MSFDPNLPQEGTPLDAVQMRSQLNGLKAIIDAILTLTAAQVDGVNTVEPGTPANATVSVNGNTLHFTFDIPRGNDGIQGQPGTNGNDGGPGPDGPQGPPFANAIVDAVNTLNPGEPATVSVSFDGSNVRFTIGIPRGSDGSSGSNGSDGAQGPPGEISQAQLDSAISGTSANTNGVSTLDNAFADPDMEALRQKLNEMILNGRR